MTDTETLCAFQHPEKPERLIGEICPRHYGRILDTLRQIEELYALLPAAVLPNQGGDGRSGTRIGSPAPGRIEAMEVTDRRRPDSVPGVLKAWLCHVDSARSLPLTRWIVDQRGSAETERSALYSGRLPVSVIVRWLQRERRWIARQEWVFEYALALSDVHHNLAVAVGVAMWPESIGKCPNCQTKLYPRRSTQGVDEITCRRCKSTWRGVHLARLRLIHEQEGSR